MNNKEFKILKLQNRIHKLSNSIKNVKCSGVLKKLRRQLKSLTSE